MLKTNGYIPLSPKRITRRWNDVVKRGEKSPAHESESKKMETLKETSNHTIDLAGSWANFSVSADVFLRNKWGAVKSRLAKREQKPLAFSVVSSRLLEKLRGRRFENTFGIRNKANYSSSTSPPGKTENARNNSSGHEKIQTQKSSDWWSTFGIQKSPVNWGEFEIFWHVFDQFRVKVLGWLGEFSFFIVTWR